MEDRAIRRLTSQAVTAFVALAFVGCGDGSGNESADAVSASELPQCLRNAGLTVAQSGEELQRLDGIGRDGLEVFPANGSVGFNAGSIYNEDADPPWEMVLVREAGPAQEEDAADGPPLSEIVRRFDEFAAVAYVEGSEATSGERDSEPIQRAFDHCVD